MDALARDRQYRGIIYGRILNLKSESVALKLFKQARPIAAMLIAKD
ncbi:hypothetical protein [Polymorphobacter megasporae]|nr:hypothetical protein [Polymorphobacter megasporae]UAJ12745.1 hypothetical protein KTC28_19560 [Polymorphobacter megasporae]